MWAPDPNRRSAWGVAALLIVGAVAGFIVAEPAASRSYRTLETVGTESEAYAVDLQEPKRLRFVLEADAAQDPETPAPAASFHVYDPADAHFASFDLEGDGDDVTALADAGGAWVVYLTQAERGQLAIQAEGEDGSAEQVRTLDVRERSWEVAAADGGSVDEDLALRMDRRPAQAYLDVDGPVQGLDASVESEEGLVHAYEDVDGTADGRLENGSQQVDPSNLAAGTYHVQAQAESLDGTLSLVAETYQRADPVQDPQEPSGDEAPEPNASSPEPPGDVVAQLAEAEAAEVPPQGAAAMAFEAPQDVDARVYLYNASHDLVEVVTLGHGDDPGDEGEGNGTADRVVVDLASSGSHAVYVASLQDRRHHDDRDDGEDPRVTVRLPDLDEAEAAADLAVEHDQLTVEGDNATATFNATGGLVAVGADGAGWSWDSGDVTVEGPRGVVLESADGDGSQAWDGWWGHGYETYPERFSDGTFTVTVEDDEGFRLGDRETEVRYGYLDR